MDTIQAGFRALLMRRLNRNMMVFLVQRRKIAVEFICDYHAAGFNVVVDKGFH